MKRLILGLGIGISILATSAMANYNKGFKYYTKYIKRKTGIKAPVFINKVLKVKMPNEVVKKFQNWKEVEEALKNYLIKEKKWTPEKVDKLFKTSA